MGVVWWLFLKHACTNIQCLSSSSTSRYFLFMNMVEIFLLIFYIRWAQSYWLKSRKMWDPNYDSKILHLHSNEFYNPLSTAYSNFPWKKWCYWSHILSPHLQNERLSCKSWLFHDVFTNVLVLYHDSFMMSYHCFQFQPERLLLDT